MYYLPDARWDLWVQVIFFKTIGTVGRVAFGHRIPFLDLKQKHQTSKLSTVANKLSQII